MRKHGGTPSRPDRFVTLAAISPPAVARGCCVGGHQSGLAGRNPPPLLMRGAYSCMSQWGRRREPWGTSPRPTARTFLHLAPTSISPAFQPQGCVRLVSKIRGDLERVQEPASNTLRPHVSLFPDAGAVGDPI